MSEKAARIARIYVVNDNFYEDTRLEIDIAEMCNTVPAVGDLI